MMLKRRRLIVNADDFGRTLGINRGILEAHTRGLVTSATLMVNFAATADAIAQLSNYPELGVGLHIALTGGKPILPKEQVSSLVDRSGRFCRKPEDFGQLEPCQVRLEIEAQLNRFKELAGQLPTHFDSHHHAHRHPIICSAVSTLAQKLGLPVRNASPDVQQELLKSGIETTDYFVEGFFGDAVGLASFSDILRNVAPGTTEVMCHPAYVDDDLRADSTYVEAREIELATLTAPAALQLRDIEGIELIHFGSL